MQMQMLLQTPEVLAQQPLQTTTPSQQPRNETTPPPQATKTLKNREGPKGEGSRDNVGTSSNHRKTRRGTVTGRIERKRQKRQRRYVHDAGAVLASFVQGFENGSRIPKNNYRSRKHLVKKKTTLLPIPSPDEKGGGVTRTPPGP